MTDAALTLTPDGAELSIKNGLITTSDGLENALAISMFGGNSGDSGREDDDPEQWWGNRDEPDVTRHIRSETAHVLESLPLTSANLQRVREAAIRDCEWITESFADSLSVTVTAPVKNRVNIQVGVVVGDSEYRFDFQDHWSNR